MLSRIKAWGTTLHLRHFLLEMLVALSLASLVWLYTHSRARESTDYIQIPVQIQLVSSQRDQFVLEASSQNRVNVSFTGPGSRVRELRRKIQRGTFQVTRTVSVPEDKLNENTICDILRIDEEDIPVPVGIKAEMADEGHTLAVTVHRLTERMLPVKLDVTGDVRVSQIKIEPPTVLVRGPKAILDRTSYIQTQPCSLHANADTSEGSDPFTRDQIALVTELEGRPVQTNPKIVNFRCKVSPKQKVYELHDIPVHFLCPPNFAYRPRFLEERPSKVSVSVIGPASDVPPPVLAFVDLTTATLARGRNLEPVRLQLPKDFQLVQTTTPLVAFDLEETDRPLTTTTIQEVDKP